MKMKTKHINCCKNEQATNIKAKQIKDIAKTQNKVKNEDDVSVNSWQRHQHLLYHFWLLTIQTQERQPLTWIKWSN